MYTRLTSIPRPGSAACLVLIALLLGGLAHPAQAQHDPFHTPVIDSILAAEDSTAAAAADTSAADTSADDQPGIIRGLNALDDVLPSRLIELLVVLGFMVIPIASAVGFGAVALFSESGCLRSVLAVMGWLASLVGGLFTGGIVGTLVGRLTFFIWMGVIGCGIGYPVLYARSRKRIGQLPREEYLTWKHTLAGAALLGTGASSAASLGRSAGTFFRGGGGSFGGGGASSTFSGGQIAQVTAASAQGAGASGAAVLTPGVAPVAAGAASVGAGGARVAAARTDASSIGGRIKRFGRALWRSFQRLRWYHGVAFVLILLIFLPVGTGVTAIFQRPRVLLWVVGVYTLWRVILLLGRVAPKNGASKAIGSILFMSAFLSPVFAAESQAPYWHLTIVGIFAIVVEIGFLVLPDNRPQAEPSPEQEPSFRGGSASAQW